MLFLGETGCGGVGQLPCASGCNSGYVPLQADWLCPNLQSGSAKGKCAKVDDPFMCADGAAYAVRSNGYVSCVNGIWSQELNTCVITDTSSEQPDTTSSFDWKSPWVIAGIGAAVLAGGAFLILRS